MAELTRFSGDGVVFQQIFTKVYCELLGIDLPRSPMETLDTLDLLMFDVPAPPLEESIEEAVEFPEEMVRSLALRVSQEGETLPIEMGDHVRQWIATADLAIVGPACSLATKLPSEEQIATLSSAVNSANFAGDSLTSRLLIKLARTLSLGLDVPCWDAVEGLETFCNTTSDIRSKQYAAAALAALQ